MVQLQLLSEVLDLLFRDSRNVAADAEKHPLSREPLESDFDSGMIG